MRATGGPDQLIVAVPDEQMRDRLMRRHGDVRWAIWRPGDTPVPVNFDLLVLPYMMPASELAGLRGQRVRVVQSQMLGWDGVAQNLPPGPLYCNAVGVHEAASAELAVALILASQRGLPEFVRESEQGRWAHARYPGLIGGTVLIVGVGGVGEQLAVMLAAFDIDLIRVARTRRNDERGMVHSIDELPELLPRADVVVLAVPLTAATDGLVGASFLDRMRRGALLVNVSRGPIVDTAILTERVARGAVRAAIDVTDPEPLPSEHPLWRLPGALISPHVGGDIDSMSIRIDHVIDRQLDRLKSGLPPLHRVVPAPDAVDGESDRRMTLA